MPQEPPERQTGDEPNAGPTQPRRTDNALSLGRLAATGTELGLTVAVLTLIGWWLDRKAGTEPWLMIGGAVVGIIGGLYKLWRINQRFFKQKH